MNYSQHGEAVDWESGMIVEWVGPLNAVGQIVNVPEDENSLMVDVLTQTGEGWESTGYTYKTGFQDVRPRERGDGKEMSADFNEDTDTMNGKYGMNLEFSAPPVEKLGDGFNEYGVRENDDGSIDVRFEAMEPGVRKGYEVTPQFLENVTSKEYGRIPLQIDHSDSQRANAGYVDPDNIRFDQKMQTQVHIPNTGSSIRQDIIADFTHEPPQITDISVGFDPKSVEVERGGRDDNPRFMDARIREFSLTPFPAGYENGGLTPAFSEALNEFAEEDEEPQEADSSLVQQTHTLIKR